MSSFNILNHILNISNKIKVNFEQPTKVLLFTKCVDEPQRTLDPIIIIMYVYGTYYTPYIVFKENESEVRIMQF